MKRRNLKFAPALLGALALAFSAPVRGAESGRQTMYQNPIIGADYSDPDAIRVGQDYYMTASSINMTPGLPILHSKDLVHWQLIGHALQKQPPALIPNQRRKADELDYDHVRSGWGAWAPALRYHDGWFWIYWGDPDAGVLMVKAKNPAGPWTKPHLVQKALGWIDPCPLWDEATRKAYLVHAYAGSRAGIKSLIVVREMSWDGKRLLHGAEKGVTIFDNNDAQRPAAERIHDTIEGPKFYKRNGWFYVLCPAGGVPQGWQTVLRSRDPLAPRWDIRTVCETGKTDINGPHQGGLLDTPSGEWWFIHFQSTGALGRITWLQPAQWKDDWPVIGVDPDGDGIGNPVHSYAMPNVGGAFPPVQSQTSDEFDAKRLGLQWQWSANHQSKWWKLKDGELHLYPQATSDYNLLATPNFVSQKFPAYRFTATAKLDLSRDADPSVRAGCGVIGERAFDVGLQRKNGKLTASYRNNEAEQAPVPLPDGPVWIRLEVDGKLPLPYDGNSQDPEHSGAVACQFSISSDGQSFTPLGENFSPKPRPGSWIGVKFGFYALAKSEGQRRAAGALEIDWVRVDVQSTTGRQ